MTTVIFDLDGTLLNTLDDLHNSVAYALRQAGLPVIDKTDTRRFLGNGVRSLIEKSVSLAAPEADKNKTDEVFGIFRQYYVEHSMEKTAPYKGVDQMLQACHERGFATAIVSNKLDEAVQDLYSKFFHNWVDLAIGESPSRRRKPAPDMVDAAIEGLSAMHKEELGGRDIRKTECVYVGDSEVDLLTAKNAGLRCVAVSWGFRDREWLVECGADCIIDRPAQLIEVI